MGKKKGRNQGNDLDYLIPSRLQAPALLAPPEVWLIQRNLMMLYLSVHVYLFMYTRSYAALRAADLDWIVGPGYSLGRVHSGEKPWKTNLERY